MDYHGFAVAMARIDEVLREQAIVEGIRMQRDFQEMMLSDYIWTPEQKDRILHNGFHFPELMSREVLVRSEKEFSAAPHHITIPSYFHRHTHVEMIYVYQGECRQYIEDSKHELVLKENQLFLLNQNVVHAILPRREQDLIIKLMLPVSFLEEGFSGEWGGELERFFESARYLDNPYYSYIIFECENFRRIREYMASIIQESYEQQACWRQAVKCYFNLLFVELQRCQVRYHHVRYRRDESIDVQAVARYIRDTCAEATLQSTARAFGYNTSYFSRMLVKKTGEGFQEMLKRIRVEKAAELLRGTSLSVEEIAVRVGYKNANSIFRLFKDIYHMTPQEYREK